MEVYLLTLREGFFLFNADVTILFIIGIIKQLFDMPLV